MKILFKYIYAKSNVTMSGDRDHQSICVPVCLPCGSAICGSADDCIFPGDSYTDQNPSPLMGGAVATVGGGRGFLLNSGSLLNRFSAAGEASAANGESRERI